MKLWRLKNEKVVNKKNPKFINLSLMIFGGLIHHFLIFEAGNTAPTSLHKNHSYYIHFSCWCLFTEQDLSRKYIYV